MSCRTSTAPPPPPRATGAARATNVRPGSRVSAELAAVGVLAAQRGRQLRRDVGMPDHFDVGPSDRRGVHAQHLLRRAVRQLDAVRWRSTHEHAFDHAREDRVERARDRATARRAVFPAPGPIRRARARRRRARRARSRRLAGSDRPCCTLRDSAAIARTRLPRTDGREPRDRQRERDRQQ